jgi:hypothetical protein
MHFMTANSQMGSARCVPFEIGRLGLLFGSREVPGSRAAWPVVLRGHLWIVGPPPPVRDRWGRPWHWISDYSHLAASKVSRV